MVAWLALVTGIHIWEGVSLNRKSGEIEEEISQAITKGDLVAAAVLSGNRCIMCFRQFDIIIIF